MCGESAAPRRVLARKGKRAMLLPRVFGWGRDRASRGARLSARLGPGGTWRVRFEAVLRIPGWKAEVRGKGRQRPFIFSERTEPGGKGGALFLFPYFFVDVQSPLSPLLFLFFPLLQLCSCRWWLEKFVDIDKSLSEILEALKPQRCRLCSQIPGSFY